MVDMSVDLGGLAMRTPVATASGTFGYGREYEGLVDYSALGAVTAKGVRMSPWPGNPAPRHVEVPGGMINAIGLQGPGAEHFVKWTLPRVRALGVPVIANVWGGSAEEYAQAAAILDAAEGVAAIEMNVSCPNVKEGGHTFGSSPQTLAATVRAVRPAVRKPLIVKLAPNVPDFAPYLKALEDEGADAVSMINTMPAMAIDIEKRRPVLGNRTGGLSGRCIHPVAVKAVYDAHRASRLPILATGGVYGPEDAIELMLAGATAVAVGTATFTDPRTAERVAAGIAAYCGRHGFAAAREITGALQEQDPC